MKAARCKTSSDFFAQEKPSGEKKHAPSSSEKTVSTAGETMLEEKFGKVKTSAKTERPTVKKKTPVNAKKTGGNGKASKKTAKTVLELEGAAAA